MEALKHGLLVVQLNFTGCCKDGVCTELKTFQKTE